MKNHHGWYAGARGRRRDLFAHGFAAAALSCGLVVATARAASDAQDLNAIPSFTRAADVLGSDKPKAEKAKIVPLLEAVARRGDARAQVMLGAVYLMGELVPPDPVIGYSWLQIGSVTSDGPYDATTQSTASDLMRKVEPHLTGAQLIKADQITQQFLREREQRIQGGIANAAKFYVGEAPTQPDLAYASDPVQIRPDLAPTPGDSFAWGCAVGPVAFGCGEAQAGLPPQPCTGSIPRSQAPPLDRKDPDVRVRRPVYPAMAARNGLEGDTRVVAHVDSSGWVCSARLGVSSGIDVLDRAAIEAVRQWRLKPALRDGTPVESLRVFVISFGLEGYEFEKEKEKKK